MHPLALPKDYRARLEKAGLLTIAPPATSDDFLVYKGVHPKRAPVANKHPPAQKTGGVPICSKPGCGRPCKFYVPKYAPPRYGKLCNQHADTAAANTRRYQEAKLKRQTA